MLQFIFKKRKIGKKNRMTCDTIILYTFVPLCCMYDAHFGISTFITNPLKGARDRVGVLS